MSYEEQQGYMEWLKENYKELYDEYNTPRTPKVRTRCNNGKNEKSDINNIRYNLNNNTVLGKEMRDDFEKLTGKKFKYANERSGNDRNSHHDFSITCTDGTQYRIEHKGCSKYKKIKGSRPWGDSGQFANLGVNKSAIGKVYCKLWYDEYILSGYLSKEHKIKKNIPTFNTWYKSDCCKQGPPGTLFGQELKRNVNNEHGKNTKVLRDLRIKINKRFLEYVNKNPELLEEFKISMINIGKDMLSHKDIWLKINGNLNDNMVHFKWYSKFQLGDEYDIKVTTKSDIDFQFTSIDKKYIGFQCKLRWRNGCGISNVGFGLS